MYCRIRALYKGMFRHTSYTMLSSLSAHYRSFHARVVSPSKWPIVVAIVGGCIVVGLFVGTPLAVKYFA